MLELFLRKQRVFFLHKPPQTEKFFVGVFLFVCFVTSCSYFNLVKERLVFFCCCCFLERELKGPVAIMIPINSIYLINDLAVKEEGTYSQRQRTDGKDDSDERQQHQVVHLLFPRSEKGQAHPPPPPRRPDGTTAHHLAPVHLAQADDHRAVAHEHGQDEQGHE